jgi:hypothetical protein
MLLVAKRLNHRPPDCFSKMPRLQELLSKKVLASERTPGKQYGSLRVSRFSDWVGRFPSMKSTVMSAWFKQE